MEYASSSESNGQIERTHATLIEIFNTNKHKIPSANTVMTIELSVALYNNTVHSSTGFTPNEVIFNQNNLINPEEIQAQARNIFQSVGNDLQLSVSRMVKQNNKKENPPNLLDGQVVFLKPNIRTKAQPRGIQTNVKNITDRTFQNQRNIKRNKNKIKRLKII